MLTNYNPDVLTCLANLSNDEVFTPPGLANDMLDLLPASLWRNPNATFLDPVCKSGVFLREIARRLDKGLETQIPDRQKRINHIFTKQVFGIAITELTSLLSRRSVYGSKTANSNFSFCDSFKNEQGNILFKKMEHTWEGGRCVFCGASQEVFDRDAMLESYAYNFIHTEEPEKIFNMKFDVIVGNPPYQLSDGGFGKSAGPIYNLFIGQAKKLNPNYLVMIIPSRWFAGGKGLNDFREEMLNDNRIRRLVDFPDASEVFPGVDIAGGVCYFLWQRDYSGKCEVVNITKNQVHESTRPLNEFNVFIRHSQSVPIITKVIAKGEANLALKVSSAKPFGLRTYIRPTKKGDLTLRWNGGDGPYPRSGVLVGVELIDKWKVITSKVSYDHGGQPDKNGTRRVFSVIDILPPGHICTETYLVVDAFEKVDKAKNLVNYLKSRLVRFLVAQLSFSQDIFKDKFEFVPDLDMSKAWTEKQLYKRYNIDVNEQAFIESLIRPMD